MTDVPRDPAEGHDDAPPATTVGHAGPGDAGEGHAGPGGPAEDHAGPGDAGEDHAGDGVSEEHPADGTVLVIVDAEHDPRSRQELLTELVEAGSRRDEYLEDVRRARAELDNFRKRTLREGAQQRDLGRIEVAGALLEVLDDLDRTLEAADGSSDDALATGVRLVADKLAAQLGAIGLQRIDDVGAAFDPTQHEAVQQQAADTPVDHPVVTQVLRPGYRLGDRVIRAAMVVVAQ